MVLSADGTRVYASDPDRDLFYVVDRIERAVMHMVELDAGCEPGRIVEDEAAIVHVACRRSGEIVTLEPETGEVRGSRWACHNPRGLMVDPSDGSTVVACAEGTLAALHMDGTLETTDVGVELRDIVSLEPHVQVSTYRSPAVVTLNASGEIVDALAPEDMVFLGTEGFPAPPRDESDDERFVPNTARRTFATSEGGWAMLHQAGSSLEVGGSLPIEGGWGGACLSAQNQVITRSIPGQPELLSDVVVSMPVVYDFALTSDGDLAAVVGPFDGGRIVFVGPLPISETVVPGPCRPTNDLELPGDPTSVAFDPDGIAWVQLREPAGFVVVDPEQRTIIDELPLAVESVADTGHDLFHHPTDALAACVSCHPEGRDDAMTWSLTLEGFRRTQSMDVGLQGGEPFHWIGDMKNIPQIFHDVRVDVMHGAPLNTAHAAALERWIFSIPPMNPAPPEDTDAIARGEAKFAEVGCTACHSGPRLSNEQTVPMAFYGKLQVPSLIGVRYRAPYMHDGRSEDLHAAVLDMLAFSLPGGPASPADRDDIVAYLQSL